MCDDSNMSPEGVTHAHGERADDPRVALERASAGRELFRARAERAGRRRSVHVLLHGGHQDSLRAPAERKQAQLIAYGLVRVFEAPGGRASRAHLEGSGGVQERPGVYIARRARLAPQETRG